MIMEDLSPLPQSTLLEQDNQGFLSNLAYVCKIAKVEISKQ